MGTDKKSFILYADQKGLFDKLPDEIAGKLIKHVFAYMDGDEPETDDLLIQIAFEPIKMQLKRDADKWNDTKEQKAKSGRIGNLKRYHSDIYEDYASGQITLEDAENVAQSRKVSHRDKCDRTESHDLAKLAVNVTVTDNVTDNVNVTNNKSVSADKSAAPANLKTTLQTRKEKFINSLAEFSQQYPKEMLNQFYAYWTELNHSQTKMKYELEKTFEISKRLAKWAANDKQFNKATQQPTSLKVNV